VACQQNLDRAMNMRVAVIGGGWAGCAAGLTLAEAGVDVTLFEAGKTLGGRARGVEINGHILDNGQHILLGAYTQTLALIAAVNPEFIHTADTGLLRLPLVLDQPPDFLLACPKLPAPLHLLVGLMTARGLNIFDKLAAARWVNDALKNRDDGPDMSVADLIANQPQTLRTCLWQPLCLAALNTPPEYASAKVFKQVLAAAFGKVRDFSDLLFPRTDLTRLFPQPAVQRILELNGEIFLQARVKGMQIGADKIQLNTLHGGSSYDRVIIAVAPQHLDVITRTIGTYRYEAIATVYIQYSNKLRLPRPMLALTNGPAQFVFDRGHTHSQAGLLAFVVSAASNLLGRPQSEWLAQMELQLLRFYTLPTPLWRKIIVEKQATYSCVPNMPRPENHTLHPFIFLAGDYTAGAYPATLESATTSGVKSAQTLINSL
jgi:squalene-associated FAD-dependent desaturase